jgi:hypothetical protein
LIFSDFIPSVFSSMLTVAVDNPLTKELYM